MWNPFRVREPQWLGLSLPKKKRCGEERRARCNTQAYLCESALVQNSLLEPCDLGEGMQPGRGHRGYRGRLRREGAR